MPGLSGIALVKRLKAEKPKMKVLVLSMHGEHQYAARALKAGASGYLTKDSAAEQLVGALRKIAGGGVHISDAAASALVASAAATSHESLSDREFEVMRLLVEGRADPKIVTARGTSPLMVAAGMGREREAYTEQDRERYLERG